MRAWPLALGACASALAAPSSAQETDPRLFDARVAPSAILGLDTSWVPPHLGAHVGLVGALVDDELVGEDPLAPDAPRGPLRRRLVSTLGVGLGLFDALELQVALPLHATEEVASGARETAIGLGDLRATLRWRALGPSRGAGGVGLALQVAAHLPTGGDAAFSTDGDLVIDPRLVVDWRSAGGVTLALEAGYRARPTRVVEDLAIGGEVRWGAGLVLPFGALGAPVPLALLAELEGAVGLATDPIDPDDAASGRKLPLEARLGLRLHGDAWALTAAAGAGITDGYGTPDFRAVVGFTWGASPIPAPPEPAERVVVATDPALAPAPTFPPAPGFGPAGEAAGPAPQVLAALAEAVASDPDADLDGVPLPADQCPEAREDRDGVDDADGCPDPDDDGDGVPDVVDKCLDQKETPNGVDDEDGCPDEGQAGVVATAGRIEIRQTIEFNSGSDVLAAGAAPIIAQIAAVLKANPQVRRVRIAGHTDSDGNEEKNVDLSERRAARVRRSLIDLGIAPERLLPKGFGPTRPIAPNTTATGRKKNRRVDLDVIDPPPPAPPTLEGAPRIEPVPEAAPEVTP
ncbi:MAG: OmpA family protein [Deltaproteobacteria bacterium]|nr:OmpA family protein [Deltaproteobacteria bacterium]